MQFGEGRARKSTFQGPRCSTCGETMPKEYWYGSGPPPDPTHCDGTQVAWQTMRLDTPHHGPRPLWPPCWKCGKSLGCPKCAGMHPLCKRCAAWGTPAGLAENGPILNTVPMMAKRGGIRAPEVVDYPLKFQEAYRRARLLDPPMPSMSTQARELLATAKLVKA